ncbi:MAG TPA: DUF4105 domain-containing protein, partial [Dongiaceae bacterium]|nr:DUF4105 domain-containing protein [Dongiaceae bacterium]
GLTAWAVAALYIDLPIADVGLPAAVVYLATIVAALVLIPGSLRKAIACVFGFLAALAWWLSLVPSNDRDWQGDVAQTPWAEIDGDKVTIHNIRNFDYRTETDYTPHWETRGYDLKDIRGADLFITFWGSPWIAHPIVSFQFGDGGHIAFSVETRKEVGEEYSALRGFFRQYELIYIIGDERDLIRVRTNYRIGEEVYLYRTTAPPEAARAIFLSYLESANDLHEKPAFYNAITSNCTTNIRIHTKAIAGANAAPWNWRLLLNGKGDEFAYEHGRLAGNLPFDQLKRQAHINDAARAADQSEQFSTLIREGRAGFGPN